MKANKFGWALWLGMATIGTANAQIFVMEASGTLGDYALDGSTVDASVVSGFFQPFVISGTSLYAINGSGHLGEYSLSGSTVNASLASGLSGATGLAVAGTSLYATLPTGVVSEYSTSGGTINASLISGFNTPLGIVASGADLFVFNSSYISEYTTSGTLVSSSLVPGLSSISAIAVSGSDLYVVSGSGTRIIGKYTTSGATQNASLISIPGLSAGITRIAVSGSSLYVSTAPTINNGSVSEYTTDGVAVATSFISGLSDPVGIEVTAVPEANTNVALALGASLLGFEWKRRKRSKIN